MDYWLIIREIKFIHETLENAERHNRIDIDTKEDIETSLSEILYNVITNVPTDVLQGRIERGE